ncbi:head GIN domain-containing protein [Pareuzebyella sediminis]|uniref:head GIN domain-containing protein n=1 Tax=Pareuzebyella sediminis TaxID=2607998 RepID=UPI0011EF7A98|nr:head GIN domain-containing protein [Pareuzebyella sediminis]
MTTLARIAIAFLIALFLSSCGMDINFGNFGTGEKGNGHIITETRNVKEDFQSVVASEGIAVYVTQADAFKIEVEADENIIDLIGTDIKNGKLRIHARENIGNATKNVYVHLPEISALSGSSGAHLKTESRITASNLDIEGSSGSLINIELTTERLKVDTSSGANLSISGNADHITMQASSGSNINAKALKTSICQADASSGGNIKVQVTETLSAHASSGGNIAYLGNPKVQTKKSVSGSVHKY